MKLLFMGSLPTLNREESREISEQEQPFITACEDMGAAAARRGHTVLIADDHQASADKHVVQGIVRYATENPNEKAHIEINRPEGVYELVYDDLPKNVFVTRTFHTELDRSKHGTGTLIPNLAALDASDVLITIGGKLTARLMGNLAADREKSVLAIPAFGGSSAELYGRLRFLYKSALKEHLEDLAVLQSLWAPDSGDRILDLAEALASNDVEAPPHSYFVSYTWDESHFADHVEVLLQRNKRAVNRDESIFRAGADLSDVVKSLIQESDTFVGLWSEQFNKSTWCPHELEYALDRNAKGLKPSRVIIVTLDDTEAPIRFTGKLRLAGNDRERRELSILRLIKEEADS